MNIEPYIKKAEEIELNARGAIEWFYVQSGISQLAIRAEVAERCLLQAQNAAIDLVEQLKRVESELTVIKAEREKVAKGNLNCIECGSLLARW